MKKTSKKITIDFFEFTFLLQACIPPRPIARTMFWQRAIDSIFHQLSSNERDHVFEFMERDGAFKRIGDIELLKHFYYRYNPVGQVAVMCNVCDKNSYHLAYEMDGRFWLGHDSFLNPSSIVGIYRPMKHIKSTGLSRLPYSAYRP